MFDLVTVGHFTIDRIISRKIHTVKPSLGGPPTYTSLAAAKLGAKVSVISKVGEDFSNEYVELLKGEGVDLSGLQLVKGASTTQFVLKYENWERKLQLKSRAPPISTKDIPSSLRAKAIHVAPVANEIHPKVVPRLRKLTGIISLDPQGFVRAFDTQGNVSLRRWRNRRMLEHIDVYKSSSEEIEIITGLRNLRLAMRNISDLGAKVVMVTVGMKGSIIFSNGGFYKIPACKSRVILDPTGAGDAFIGAFLAEYVNGKDPLWCACVGSAAASFVVEGVGSAVFGEREETYARATEIYEKGIKHSIT